MQHTPSFLVGATDTHVHVFDPARYAYSAGRRYTPGAAPVAALRAQLARFGLERVVLVQPSVYGTDNGCLLDAIAQLGPDRCRGIAVVDLDRPELRALHAGGVRGIRLNLEVHHESDPQVVGAQLAQAAAAVDLPGWCVQLHCAPALLPVIAQHLPAFRVPLVLDHLAGLRVGRAEALPAVLELLDSGRVYVKLSAFFRASSSAPYHADLAPIVRALIEAGPDRLLWGSDWPYTGGGRDRDPNRIEPFRSIDLAASLAALRGWAGDAEVLQQILVANPAALYGFAA